RSRPRRRRRRRARTSGAVPVRGARPLPCDDRTAMAVICTLGDALLDVVVRLDEALAPGDDVTATTRTGAGGQAANVAAWAAALGAEARCVCKRGDDPAGTLVAAELEAR